MTLEGNEAETVSVISSKALRHGIKILGCISPSKPCKSLATQCEIQANATLYDNGGRKSLWPTEFDVDFEIIENKGTSDSLKVKILSSNMITCWLS